MAPALKPEPVLLSDRRRPQSARSPADFASGPAGRAGWTYSAGAASDESTTRRAVISGPAILMEASPARLPYTRNE